MNTIERSFLYLRNGVTSLLPSYCYPPILIYHKLSSKEDKRDAVSLELFRKQMEFIKRLNLGVMPLDQLRAQAANSLYLTFDDGTQDFFYSAWPVIKQYSYPVTVFMVAGRIGKPGYLDAGQLKQLIASGLVKIGSHTMTHRSLLDLNYPELEYEIKASKSILEEVTGSAVEFIAYPWGEFTDTVRDLVRASGYKAAFSTNQGYKKKADRNDTYAIKRLTITNKESWFGFLAKISGFATCFSRTIRAKRRK